jgi:hypothetical protein
MEILIIAILIVFLIGAAIALVLSLNSLINLFRDKVPYVSTPQWAIDWIGQHTKLADGATLVDIGCGDGRVLIGLKKYLSHVTMIGYERQWWPWLLAQWKTRGTGVMVRRKSFYDADLSNVDVVFCFLIHAVMPKVERLLKSKLKPGATVYSYGFWFPTWDTTDKIVNPSRPQGSKINIYKV